LDGEEESGSPNIDHIVAEHRELLADADVFLMVDGSDGSGDGSRPSVWLGSRGLAVARVSVTGPERDLHSGHWGGTAPNPAWALIRLLGSMKDDSGRVTIEEFYDEVEGLRKVDRETIAAIPIDEAAIRIDLGIRTFADGPGESHLEKTMYWPTLNINDLAAGYFGEGYKTIVPAEASATVDMRLVVDQDAEEILDRFEHHVRERTPDEVTAEVERLATRNPDRTPFDSPWVTPIVGAIQEVWGVGPVVYPTAGASGPTDIFADLGLPVIVTGYSNSDLKQHSQHESMTIASFERGIRTSGRVLMNAAESDPQ
jgi:acetylornithine deacetylase/succinyl-diaminopimelate desuccinylase-like protein